MGYIRMFKGCFNEVIRVVQEHLKCVVRIVSKGFKTNLRYFKGSLKDPVGN